MNNELTFVLVSTHLNDIILTVWKYDVHFDQKYNGYMVFFLFYL